MNDNDIIRALKCCGNQMYSCTDKRCKAKTIGEALDLINRQKAEIERLKTSIKEADEFLSEGYLGKGIAIIIRLVKEMAEEQHENV